MSVSESRTLRTTVERLLSGRGFFLLAAALAGLGLALLFGSGKIPLHQDAIVFGPPAVELQTQGTFTNSIWEAAKILDQTGEGRFNYYGFLFPLLTAWLFRPDAYGDLIEITAFYRGLVPLLFAVCVASGFHRLGWKWNRRPALAAWLGLFAILPICAQHDLGRPEDFAIILLALGFLLGTRCPSRWWFPLALAGSAIAFLVHPLSGLSLGLVAAAIAALQYDEKRAFVLVATGGGSALLLALAGFAIHPVSLEQWLHGFGEMVRHSLTEKHPHTWDITATRLWTLSFPFALLLCAGAFGAHPRLRNRIRAPWMFVLALLVLAGVTLFFATVRPRNYNIRPAGFFIALTVAMALASPLLARYRWRWALITWAVASGVFGLLQASLLLVAWATGPAIGEIRAEISALREIPGAEVGLSDRIFYAWDDPREVEWLRAKLPPEYMDPDARFLLLARIVDYGNSPPAVPGYRLVGETWQPEFVGQLPDALQTRYRGFGWAIYEASPPDPDAR